MANNKIDPKTDTLRQFLSRYNTLVDSVLLKDGEPVSNATYQTGLSWDSDGDNLFIDLDPKALFVGDSNRGVKSVDKTDLVRQELNNLDLDLSKLHNLQDSRSNFLYFRYNTNNLRDSLDHNVFKFVYVQEKLPLIQEKIPLLQIPLYYWDSDSDLDDDDLTVIRPNSILSSSKGRWIFIHKDLVPDSNPTDNIWVSPKGLDTDAGTWFYPLKSLSLALERVEDNGTVYLFPGDYIVESTLNINKPINLVSPDGLAKVIGKSSPVLKLGEGMVIKNVYFSDEDSSITDTIHFQYQGYRRGDGQSGYNTSVPIKSRIENCRFQSAGRSILIDTDLNDNYIAPLDKEVTLLDIIGCRFNSPQDSSILSTRLASIFIENCSFQNCHRISEARDGGIVRVFNSQSYRGDFGFLSSGNHVFRNVAYLRELIPAGNTVSSLLLQFYQTDTIFNSDQFYPRMPVFINLVQGGDGLSYNNLLVSVNERVEDEGETYYRCQLGTDLNLNVPLEEGSRFEVFQMAFTEVVSFSAWRMGEGVLEQPDQQYNVLDASHLVNENGQGIVHTSQVVQT